MFSITPLGLYMEFISIKYESQYIELQKSRNNQFPKEIKHEGIRYHYNITFVLSEGRCRLSDEYFRMCKSITGVRKFRPFCRSTFQRILDMGNFLYLVQPQFDQITIYHQDDLERPLEQYCPVFSERQLTLPITNFATGKTVYPKKSKKKTSKLPNSKDSQKIIRKKSKEEEKLDRISANAELVEMMNKIKVSIKIFSEIPAIYWLYVIFLAIINNN